MSISNLLWYVDGKLSIKKRDELSNLIREHLPKDDGEQIMKTIADSYREEGINKGVNKGILIGEARGEARGIAKTVKKMLQQNLNLKLISSVTGFSSNEILKLKNKM